MWGTVALTCDSCAAMATRNAETADLIPSCAAMAIVEYGTRAVYQFRAQLSCHGDDKKIRTGPAYAPEESQLYGYRPSEIQPTSHADVLGVPQQ